MGNHRSLSLSDITIVIPVGRHEPLLKGLLECLIEYQFPGTIILVVDSTGPRSKVWCGLKSLPCHSLNLEILTKKGTRADKLNYGARAATSLVLWFLHADSTFKQSALFKLKEKICQNPDTLCFFKLKFSDKASPWLWLNEWGVKIRSGYLGIPFGDQGMAILREHFLTLGMFPVGLEYGEDHVFVWQARLAGFALKEIDDYIWTSARKYNYNGWLSTTIDHAVKTWLQAAPFAIALAKKGIRGNGA